jgi:para-aminobenzoate synthetase component 1
MNLWVERLPWVCEPERLLAVLRGQSGRVCLRSQAFEFAQAGLSFVTASPFLSFRCFGSQAQVGCGTARFSLPGDPWRLLEVLLARYETVDEVDLPFPLGGCFGFWGYDLKHHVEPRVRRRTCYDLEVPDCDVGFYASLVVFDHRTPAVWIVATGLDAEGATSRQRAVTQRDLWHRALEEAQRHEGEPLAGSVALRGPGWRSGGLPCGPLYSSLDRDAYLAAVQAAQRYIRQGDIYQVNLARRLTVASPAEAENVFRHQLAASPAPFAAFLEREDYALCSASPELFLRFTGRHVQTRPIKGTRPRAADPVRDIQLSYELQSSAKERAELVMITDLLRNDLGRVCEYGSVSVPELIKLEKFSHVQHLVSTVEGELRPAVSHLDAMRACFPGGSVTGAPKVRAMEIIEELEPVARGPYTGCVGYLGFNRESQLSILIRTTLAADGRLHFHAGSGILADSDPAAEFDETGHKARAFLDLVAPSTQVRTGWGPAAAGKPR